MSQVLLDEQIDMPLVLPELQKWTKAQALRHLCRDGFIPDERVPAILLTLRQPTFVTIDADFWDRSLCHPGFGIVYFALRDTEQHLLSGLLRALFRLPEFKTRGRRMGKVV